MDLKELNGYAAMSKLEVSKDEETWIHERATMLSESFRELLKIDAQGVEPLVNVVELKNVMRDDIDFKMLPRDDVLANAPEQYEGYFQAPRTLE